MLDSTTLQVGALTAAVTFISAFVKNVGALGVFMPVAIQAAERRKRPVSRYLMPLAFGSLIGGTITQIGTSPNILISQVRQEITRPSVSSVRLHLGRPAVVIASPSCSSASAGACCRTTAAASLQRRSASPSRTTPARPRCPKDSPFVGKTVADLEELGEGEVTVAAYHPRAFASLCATCGTGRCIKNDILVLQGDPTALQPMVDQAKLELLGRRGDRASCEPQDKDDVLETTEAVICPNSPLIGRTPQRNASAPDLRGEFAGTQPQRSDATRRGCATAALKPAISSCCKVASSQLARAESELHLLPLAERSIAVRSSALALSAAAHPCCRDDRHRRSTGAGRSRLLRCRDADRAAAADHAARGLRRRRLARHRHARLPDPGWRGAEGYRRRAN